TSPVLIVALIRRDEGVCRNSAGLQVRIKTTRTIKANNVSQIASRLDALLDAAEVGERIVLDCVKVDQVAGCQRRTENRHDHAKIRVIREVAVAIVYVIGAYDW